MKFRYRPTLFLVDREVEQDCQEMIRSAPEARVSVIDRKSIAEFFQENQHVLYLTKNRGRFLKWCPARKPTQYHCCGYRTVDLVEGCPLGCGYCILQAIENRSFLTAYVNVHDLLEELRSFFSTSPGTTFRIGTGELADSLVLEPILGQNRILVEFFSGQQNAILELKTKSDVVEPLLDLNHAGHTVVAFSLNPPPIDRDEEFRTATFSERVTAAEKCVSAGYRVGFHFDPLILHNGWEENYRRAVHEIFSKLEETSIAWISLGSLRMPEKLLTRIRFRRPLSYASLAELHPGFDGLLRYLRPVRRRMYKHLSNLIKSSAPSVPLYICMEPREVTDEIMIPGILTEDQLLQYVTNIHSTGRR